VLHCAGGAHASWNKLLRSLPAAERQRETVGRRGPPGGTGPRRWSSRSRRLPVLQRPQNGTGHAMQNRESARAEPRKSLLLCSRATLPSCATDTLKALIAAHHNGNAAATVLSAVLGRSFRLRPGCAQIRKRLSPRLWKNRSSPTSSARSTKSIRRFIALPWRNSGPALAQVKPNNKHREFVLDRRHRRAKRQGRNRAGASGPPIRARGVGMQYARGFGRGRPRIPGAENATR